MSPETVRALAALGRAFTDLARALQVEAQVPPATQRMKLSEVARAKGIPSSTLSALIRSKKLTASRVGVGRGHYMLDPLEVEAYFRRNETKAQTPYIREAASL